MFSFVSCLPENYSIVKGDRNKTQNYKKIFASSI